MGRRQFAADVNRTDFILMFDPSTAEALELQQNIASFHNEELVNDRESYLTQSSFDKLLGVLRIEELPFNKCLGYKVPLFLGGKDKLDNYELSDLEVYWDFQSQIYHQIKDLPPGTKINSIKLE
jgi:hypothetical protein